MERMLTYMEFMTKVAVIKACLKELKSNNFTDKRYLKHAVLQMVSEIEISFNDHRGRFRKWLEDSMNTKDDKSITNMLIESPCEIYDVLDTLSKSNNDDSRLRFNTDDYFAEAIKRHMSDDEGSDTNA